MLVSFIVTAYNASSTITATLNSIASVKKPDHLDYEAIVVDDGSTDTDKLEVIVKKFKFAKLVSHVKNYGMCAARNTGIRSSKGDFITILDADDTLVENWPEIFREILADWPQEINICYSACVNERRVATVSQPDYCGTLSLSDILNERYTGEYMPIFRAEFVQKNLFIDIGTRKSCGILSYINYAKSGPIWITPLVLRIYHENQIGSVTSSWARSDKALETVTCYKELFKRYGELYQENAPAVWRTKKLRMSVYLKLSGSEGAWRMWFSGASFLCLKETLGAFLVLSIGAEKGAVIVTWLREVGLIRRYG